jgi:UDP-N-acetylmuramyl pentapeptide phosphotransferase/UDP-N-acetylglucosamine-1-phosphate transferase
VSYLLPVVILSITSWGLVYGIRHWTERRKILDVPNVRSSHIRPTPRGGGLAIAVISIAGFAVYWVFRPVRPWPVMAGYIIGASSVAVISWLDDLRSLSTLARFTAHTAAATLLILGCGAWDVVAIPFVGDVSLAWLGVALTLIWIVGLTNAYNFMDGIDGIAAAQAVVAGVGWLILGGFSGQPVVGVLGLLVAASSLGFLPHNRPPARIFMGDVGSAFLGYSFAFLAVVAAQADPRLCLAGVLLIWPFVFDTAITFLRRLRKRENVFAAHRSHLYQRLVIAGWTHGRVTLLYAGLALLGLVLAVLFAARAALGDWLAAVLLPLAALALWLFVGRQESRHAMHAAAVCAEMTRPREDRPQGQPAKP